MIFFFTEETKTHYVLIKDFNKFMYNETKHKERKYFFMYCFRCFSSNQVLTNLKENCKTINGEQAIKMPEKGSKVKFNNFQKQLPVPFVIYADFEAIKEKVYGCKPNNDNSYTKAYQKHTNCGYGYKVVCCYDGKYTKSVQIYRGENAVYRFMKKMLEELKYCKNILKYKFNKPLKMTKENDENL